MESLAAMDIDQIPVPALLVRRDGSIVLANDHSERLFDYGRGELADLEFEQLIHEEHRQEWRQLLETALARDADQPWGLREITAVIGDAHEVEVDVGPTSDGSGAVVVLRDVTEAVQALAELRAADQRLRIGALHTNDLVQFIDIQKDHLGWYGDLDNLLGYDSGEFPRTLSGWLELIHPDDLDRIQAEFERTAQNPNAEGWSLRYRIRAADGSYRHLLDRGTFTGYVDGDPSEGIGGIIDETEQVLARQELEAALQRVAELKDRLQAESTYLRSEVEDDQGFGEIIGSSEAIAATLRQVDSVAGTDATVLLLGETGTGKELLARAIHNHSRRRERPLIKVDCATLPSTLIESELFGHEKGSFTGAHERKIGRFELAHEGTVFLDEIGELPLALQSKLLRVIEEGELQRIGGKSEQRVDVRVIAATNRDLRLEVREGRFRTDLYYRLSVFPIESPPLRERREDIPLLVSFFLSRYAASLGKTINGVSEASMDALVAYDWPGNVRELRNVVERSVILCRGDTLTVDPALLGTAESPLATGGPLKADLQAVERAHILRALEEASWKIKGEGNAASRLGVTPSGLRSRMKRLGIARPT